MSQPRGLDHHTLPVGFSRGGGCHSPRLGDAEPATAPCEICVRVAARMTELPRERDEERLQRAAGRLADAVLEAPPGTSLFDALARKKTTDGLRRALAMGITGETRAAFERELSGRED